MVMVAIENGRQPFQPFYLKGDLKGEKTLCYARLDCTNVGETEF